LKDKIYFGKKYTAQRAFISKVWSNAWQLAKGYKPVLTLGAGSELSKLCAHNCPNNSEPEWSKALRGHA
jgi:hypothetical protein